jgi:hypothetical protein
VKPPFICVKAGSEACGVMLMMLDELDGLRPHDKRVMTLRPNDRPKAFSKIRFEISPASEELVEMSLTIEPDAAAFEFTPSGLIRFREAIILWQRGESDFSIRPSRPFDGTRDAQSGEVWFWTESIDP